MQYVFEKLTRYYALSVNIAIFKNLPTERVSVSSDQLASTSQRLLNRFQNTFSTSIVHQGLWSD